MKKMLNLIFLLLLTIGISIAISELKENQIIDSNLSLKESLTGTNAPKKIIDSLKLINVDYLSIDNKIHRGQIVVNIAVEEDVVFFFKYLLDIKFVIEKVKPICLYDWSDDESMKDNNSSGFNFRNIAGTNRLSNHSFGRAIDINPRWNPVVHKDGSLSPTNGSYNKSKNGSFYGEHPIVIEMKKRGWRWGGEFSKYADNHHFDKLN
jgi:hypothetical protein